MKYDRRTPLHDVHVLKSSGKGAGSRGGKVIGMTHGGKPIYASSKAGAAVAAAKKAMHGDVKATGDSHKEHMDTHSGDGVKHVEATRHGHTVHAEFQGQHTAVRVDHKGKAQPFDESKDTLGSKGYKHSAKGSKGNLQGHGHDSGFEHSAKS